MIKIKKNTKSVFCLLLTSVLLFIIQACSTFTPFKHESTPVTESSSLLDNINISYEKFTLDNGLRVLVHSDHNAPIVNIQVRYHVGGKDEPAGRSGFAHLFEHLMFNGSKNYNTDFFKGLSDTGATDVNGNTSVDRTLYYENVPTHVLERALWLEADRMANLVITPQRLDQQRAVVKNEKRKRSGSSLGDVETLERAGVFPVGHPYHFPPIGSITDLNKASLADVKDWYKSYYGASNVVINLSGDIDVATAKRLVNKYFGDIEAGEYIARKTAMVPYLNNNIYEQHEANIAADRLVRIWPISEGESKDTALLKLFSQVLSKGKNSVLHQRLVDSGLASQAIMYVVRRELASMFKLVVVLKDPKNKAKVTAIIDEQLQSVIKDGVDEQQLQQIKSDNLVHQFRKMEDLGEKSALLGNSELYAGDPMHFMQRLTWMEQASSQQLSAVVKKWLTRGYYQLSIKAVNKGNNKSTSVNKQTQPLDRSIMPPLGIPAKASLPHIQQARLNNGIKVLLVERHTVPFIHMNLLFDSGIAAEQALPDGVAIMAAQLMEEGSKRYSGLEVEQQLQQMGSQLSIRAEADWIKLSMSMLKNQAGDTLKIVTDLVKAPAYTLTDIEKKRSDILSHIKSTQNKSGVVGKDLMLKILLGEQHMYVVPNQGFGTLESVKSISKADIQTFHDLWIIPEKASLLIVGDTTLAQLLPQLNQTIGAWQALPPLAVEKPLNSPIETPKTQVFLIDRPNAKQTNIRVGQLAPMYHDDDSFAFETANRVLGNGFTSRINLNIREDKGWAYGANSTIKNMRESRMWYMYSSVQTDKTQEAISEFANEIEALRSTGPVSQVELDKDRTAKIGKLVSRYQTAKGVLKSMTTDFTLNRPLDYAQQFEKKYQQLSVAGIKAVMQRRLQPEHYIWVIIGDLAKIEQEVRALNLGPVTIITK